MFGTVVIVMSAVLKLVQAQQFSEQLDVDIEALSGNHSLQGAFQYASPWEPYIARYVIERFSKKGAVVLDPQCSAGTVGLESVMAGRSFIGCAEDHSLVKLARARLFPVDLAEVALRLQFVSFKKPVDIRGYCDLFPFFFDADTFRELVNLKTALRGATDPAAEFISFIVASILHGHTAGHLSAYTSPSAALSADAQASLNRKRGEIPSYRAVGARVLKKAALVLRDGVPSVLQSSRHAREVFYAGPTAINSLQTASVDLGLLAPEQPGVFEHGLHSWLRTWWLGVDVPEGRKNFTEVSQWAEHINEVLLEMARVVNKGGRVVARLGQGRIGSKPTNYASELQNVVSSCLAKFWHVEGSISERHVENSPSSKARAKKPSGMQGELVVLRRR